MRTRSRRESRQPLKDNQAEAAAVIFFESVAFGRGSWTDIFDATDRAMITATAHTRLDRFYDPERPAINPAGLKAFPRPLTISVGDDTLPTYREVCKILRTILPDADKLLLTGQVMALITWLSPGQQQWPE